MPAHGPAATAGAERPPPPSWNVGFGFIMTVAMGVATFVGFVIGVLGPFLIAEFDLSRSQLGALSTVLYLVGGFGSPVAGKIADRVGGRAMLLALFAAGAVGTVGVAVARSYAWLVAAMALAGLALASGNPVTNKLIAEYIPPGRRGTVMGVKQAGVPLGLFLAGVVMPAAALWLGWRGAVLLGLLVPVAGTLGALLLLPSGKRDGGSRAARAHGRSSAAVRWLTAYAFLMGTGVAVVNVHLAVYAYAGVGLTVTTAGAVASLTGIVGVLARVAWGRAAELFEEITGPLAVIAACSAAAMTLLLVAQHAGAWALWAGAVLFGASTLGWIVVGMIGVVSETRAEDTGRASGIVLFGFYGGFISSPVVFGAVVDLTGRYDLAWGLVALVFALACAVALLWRARTRPSPG